MFVLKKYYEPRSVFVLKLFQTFCILLVVFLDSLNHLCKCIQLGWCVFHLKNKCLGLHIGKNKEVLQWIYVTIQWVLIWCQNKYLPSVRKKRNKYLYNITIFSNGLYICIQQYTLFWLCPSLSQEMLNRNVSPYMISPAFLS